MHMGTVLWELGLSYLTVRILVSHPHLFLTGSEDVSGTLYFLLNTVNSVSYKESACSKITLFNLL